MIAIVVRELHAHYKGLLAWVLSLAAFMYLSMAKFGTLSEDAAASQQLLESLPSTMQAVFGMTGLDLTSIAGYYGICFIFVAVILAIHAGMLGAGIISKEENDRTAEFLYVKPISRAVALTGKIIAGIIMLVIIFITSQAATLSAIASVSSQGLSTHIFSVFSMALLLIQLIFFSVGVCIAAAFAWPKKASAIAATLISLTYITHVLHNLSDAFAWMRHVSPFAWFNAEDILANSSLATEYVIATLTVVVAATICAYIAYNRRDFTV